MSGVTATFGVISGAIKSALEVLKTVTDTKIAAAVSGVLEKLQAAQNAVLELQSQAFDMQIRNQELQQDLDKAKNWKEKISDFEVVQVGRGATVYQRKTEPRYYACPNCINKQEIQPLQLTRSLANEYRCPSCATNYPVGHPSPQPPTGGVVYGRSGRFDRR